MSLFSLQALGTSGWTVVQYGAWRWWWWWSRRGGPHVPAVHGTKRFWWFGRNRSCSRDSCSGRTGEICITDTVVGFEWGLFIFRCFDGIFWWWFLCLLVAEPITGTRAVLPGPLNDVRAEAPHVHPAIWFSSIPHGAEGLPWFSHARSKLSPHVRPNGSTPWLPYDENAGTASTSAHWRRPQPAQHTTTAAPAPATVTAGTFAKLFYMFLF